MKHLLTLLSFLPLFVAAQNISVKSFRVVTDDMTARVTNPVTDQNGDKCALIKVRTSQKGFVFEGDMLGITKTQQEIGEIWVYVPAKAKKITIKHQQLGVLDNYLYTESIKEATVYIMDLTTAKVVTSVVEEEIKTAYLIIHSEPEGADVYIDDTYMGVTPFNKKLTTGQYKYRIEKSMFETIAGNIAITGETLRQELKLNMVSSFGFAQIITKPENGASVEIDGEPITNLTPVVSGKLKEGTHRVKVKMPMYQPEIKEFNITKGDTSVVEIELKPSFAVITVNTSPESDIYVNAEKVGFGTYTGRVMEGIHSFEARKESYNSNNQRIEVKAGEEKTINLNLDGKTGKLDVMTSPMDAIIIINGQEKGKTPTTVSNLMIGEYEVTIKKEGYNDIVKNVTIAENKITELNETLAKDKKAAAAKKKEQDEKIAEEKPESNKEEIVLKEPKKEKEPKIANNATGSKYKTAQIACFSIAGAAAATGGYYFYSANKKYNEYKIATDNATNLHTQIKTQDLIWQASFGVATAALATGIYFTIANNKAKQTSLKASYVPFNNGAGIKLSYNF